VINVYYRPYSSAPNPTKDDSLRIEYRNNWFWHSSSYLFIDLLVIREIYELFRLDTHIGLKVKQTSSLKSTVFLWKEYHWYSVSCFYGKSTRPAHCHKWSFAQSTEDYPNVPSPVSTLLYSWAYLLVTWVKKPVQHKDIRVKTEADHCEWFLDVRERWLRSNTAAREYGLTSFFSSAGKETLDFNDFFTIRCISLSFWY